MSLSNIHIPRVLKHFSYCTDPRTRPVKYPLMEIILIIFLSTICGEEGWEAMVDWANDKLDFLRKFLPYENEVPSPDTIRRVTERLDPQEFLSAFTLWVSEFKERHGGQICIDGKTLKRAMKDDKPLHIVSAWSEENRMVLGALSTDSKSNEIPTIEQLLDKISLQKGDVVTIDAIGCQKNIASLICRKGADYMIALKKNQRNLADEIENFFDQAIQAPGYSPCTAFSTTDKGHGKKNIHEVWVSEDLDWLPQRNDWQGLSSIVMIKHSWVEKGKTKEEKRYFISTLSGCDSRFAQISRRHWSIENELHWHLDVTFGEDSSEIGGTANENLRIARMVALDMLKSEKTHKKGLKAKMRRCVRSDSYLEKVLMAGNF